MLGVVLVEILDGLFERDPSLYTHTLIESEVGFICHTVGCGRIDNRLVESEDGILLFQQVLWNFLDVGVETYAQEGLLGENLFNEFFTCHIVMYF